MMVKNSCKREEVEHLFYSNLYNQLYIIETHYHGSSFVGNHMKKILNFLNVVIDLIKKHLAYEKLLQYF